MTCLLLVLVAVAIQSPAQNSGPDRQFFEDTKAKAEKGHAPAQSNLGLCYANGQGVLKDTVEAVNWLRKAAADGADSAFNNLAWILATSKNPIIRDGSNAVIYGEKAVAATDRKNPTNLDTLAAANAEAGQFEKAISTQQEAILLLKTEAEKDPYRSRLKL